MPARFTRVFRLQPSTVTHGYSVHTGAELPQLQPIVPRRWVTSGASIGGGLGGLSPPPPGEKKEEEKKERKKKKEEKKGERKREKRTGVTRRVVLPVITTDSIM